MKDQERVKSESGGGKRSEKKNRNKEILVVMYSFIFLFLATIGYFVYFDAVQSKDIITHPGNIHIAKLQDHTLRGRILASDGSDTGQNRCRCRRKGNKGSTLMAMLLLMWWERLKLINPDLRHPMSHRCFYPMTVLSGKL